ncbi:MAG: ATP-binding protein [Desulfatirhabdiaceae bacterium]
MLELPAKIENMEALMTFVSDRARSLGFSARRIKEIELASEEALVNIINYAYKDCDGIIRIVCSGDPIHLIIQIEDYGSAFDILSLSDPDTTSSLTEREVGGLGVFLIRKLMDDVTYSRQDGRNILTLFVRLPDA